MYHYEDLKPKLFTEKGQRNFLKVRDYVHKLLNDAGAFSMGKAMIAGGDSWEMMMYIDRLVELGEIREITNGNVAGQNRVFVKA